MHEFGLATSLIDAAVAEARGHGARAITAIRCRIGRLRQVDEALFREAFDVAKSGTPACGAKLDVVYTPLRMTCLECGLKVDLDIWRFDCPRCQTARIWLDGSDEVALTSLDVEAEDEN